jgi:hypothetical protein
MSPPGPAHRRARVLELKQGAALNREAGGLQLQHHRQAVAEIADEHGIVAPDCPVELWLGDPDAVLHALGCW